MRRLALETSRETALHRIAPIFKLAGALLIILSTVLLPRGVDWRYAIPASFVLLLWPVAGMTLGFMWRRMLLAEFFIVGIALFSLFHEEARPVFFSALAKSNISVFTLLLLSWTTPFHMILRELRRWGMPGIMVTTLALMIRYLPVLAEESSRMQRARASRGFRRRKGLAWANLTLIIGQLYIRSADRAERIYLAMCARGWE
jgi:cobalt/nickel transport system permease protein